MNPFASRFSEIDRYKKVFLDIASKKETPFYIFDKSEALKNIKNFKDVFRKESVDIRIFFATKSNYYSGLLRSVVGQGEGLDVSGQRELKLALKAGAKRIIYTGPAKTEKDFELILKHHTKITVNLESLRELHLLSEMAVRQKKKVRCGARVYTKSQAGWTKFGMPLHELKAFFDKSLRLKGVHFCGIHFHISFNKTPEKYVATLNELADYLKKNFSKSSLQLFEYIDIGGGFYPRPFEGAYAWNPDSVMDFSALKGAFDKILSDEYSPRFEPEEVDPIEKFAKEIAFVYKNRILKLMPNAELYAEPGRFISHSAMHFLLKMIDIKGKKMGIVDGGNNMIGWEKYQFFNYVPIFNLSQFDKKNEIPFVTYGPLCTPDDIWGYYIYSEDIPKNGDIICMPFQGAYTYTLAQEFIKDIPPVYDL